MTPANPRPVGACFAAVAVAVAWSSTLWEVVPRWFASSSEFAHGPWVVIVSALLWWRGRERVEDPDRRGLVLMWAAVVLHLLALRAGITFISAVALIALLAGWSVAAGRWRAQRASILLLLFAVPWPMAWAAHVQLELKQWAAAGAVELLCHATQLDPALDHGRVVWAGQALRVSSDCSGLRSLLALLWIGCVLASVSRRRWWLVPLAAALALAGNVVRIATIVLLVDRGFVHAGDAGSTLHQSVGLAVFACAATPLLALVRVRRRHGAASREPRQPMRGVLTGAPALAALVGALIVPSLQAVPAVPAALPDRLVAGGRPMRGRDLPALDATAHRRFVTQAGDQCVDAVVVTGDVHPVEVCFEGLGASIASRRVVDDACELITDHGELRIAHVYIYTAGNHATTSYTRQQVRALLGEPTSLLRVSSPAFDGDTDAAMRRARDAFARLVLR